MPSPARGQVTPPPSDVKTKRERALWEAFCHVDSDGSGSCSKRELMESLNEFAKKHDDANLSELAFLYHEADKDRSGQINFQEFCEMAISLPQIAQLGKKPRSHRQPASPHAVSPLEAARNAMRNVSGPQFVQLRDKAPLDRHEIRRRLDEKWSKRDSKAKSSAANPAAAGSSVVPPQPSRPPQPGLSAHEKKLWHAFSQVDYDGSGTCSKRELFEALHEYAGHPR